MSLSEEADEHIPEKPRLELRELPLTDPDTKRIFAITRQAIDRLNIYVDDFYQTREILAEGPVSKDPSRQKEQHESLQEIIKRISEIRTDMEEMARELGDFVVLKTEE